MNFIYLKYFCDAVKLGGVSAAAKANFVTQSAISQGIAKLEKSLGVPLLAHHPNRFRLTPVGEMAFQRALEILRQVAEFSGSFGENNLGNLEFACTYSFAVAVIPQFLKRFKAAYPHVKVNFFLGKKADIKQMLKTGAIDFGMGPDEGDLEELAKQDIYKGNFGLYISSLIKKKDQKNLGFILAEPDCYETAFFKEAFYKKYGREPQILLKVNSWEVIANLVSAGLGIGYFPDYITLSKKGSLRPLDLGLDSFDYRICAFSPNGYEIAQEQRNFPLLFQKSIPSNLASMLLKTNCILTSNGLSLR